MTSIPSSIEPKPRTRTAPRRKRLLRRVGLGLLAMLVLAAVVFLIARSRGLIQFPALTGPYPVGKVIRHLIDESRPEVFSATLRQAIVEIASKALSAVAGGFLWTGFAAGAMAIGLIVWGATTQSEPRTAPPLVSGSEADVNKTP
jgi:hypothetical protein